MLLYFMAVVLTWPNTGLCGECPHDKDKALSMFRANVEAPQSKGRAVRTNRTWEPNQLVICTTVCVCLCVCVCVCAPHLFAYIWEYCVGQ